LYFALPFSDQLLIGYRLGAFHGYFSSVYFGGSLLSRD